MARAQQVIHKRPALEQQLGFSMSVGVGNTLYISGLPSADQQGGTLFPNDMRAQIQHIYTELAEIAAERGFSFADVVKETVYTLDLEQFLANADARLSFFKDVAAPAATWIQVAKMFAPGMLLEVELTLQRE